MYRAIGCDKCNKTGYKGPVDLHELMIADDAVKKLIQERHAHTQNERHGKKF